MNKTRKELLGLIAGLALAQSANGNSLSDRVESVLGTNDVRSRIVYGYDTKSAYEAALTFVEQSQYDMAQDYLLRVIETGPACKEYSKAAEWLTDKLWKHILARNPSLIETARTAADMYIDAAGRLKEDDPKRKELLSKAQKQFELALKRKRELEQAVERTGGKK